MDVIILAGLLRTILTVKTVWNTGETGDINTYFQTKGRLFIGTLFFFL